jgi:hypothetical protein
MKIPRFFLRKRTARFAQLAQRDDIRVVGPLAEALRSWDGEAQAIAEAALIRLLPRLRAEHDVLLTPDQRKNLHRALRGKNESLSLAILKALRHIGDAESLICVTRMVYERSRSGIDSRLQEAAIDLLPELRERVEEQRAVATLLRASEPSRLPDEHLRPSDAPGVPLSTLRDTETTLVSSPPDKRLAHEIEDVFRLPVKLRLAASI